LLNPRERLLKVYIAPGQIASYSGDQPLGDDPLRRMQPLEEDTGLLADGVADDLLTPTARPSW
jgi:hypothetical protein